MSLTLPQMGERFGPGHVIALSEVHTDALELIEHGLVLDPLGDGRNPERSADLADRLHHAPVHGVGGDLTDELAVDLEVVYWECLQLLEKQQPKTKNNKHEFAAARLERAHEEGNVGKSG